MDGTSSVGSPEILLHAGPDEVAEALAARLMARVSEIQRDFRTPQVALTGGRIATRAYQRLADEGPAFLKHVQTIVEEGRLDETFVDAICDPAGCEYKINKGPACIRWVGDES